MSYIIPILCQLTYIPFVYWFVELIQNNLYLLVTGSYGWIYPTSPYNYFTFESVKSWAVMPILFWTIYYFFLLPKKVNLFIGFVITGTAGYITEFIVGYVSAVIFHETMQEWPNSKLKFVGGIGSYCLWILDAVMYYWIVFKMPKILTEHLKDYRLLRPIVDINNVSDKKHRLIMMISGDDEIEIEKQREFYSQQTNVPILDSNCLICGIHELSFREKFTLLEDLNVDHMIYYSFPNEVDPNYINHGLLDEILNYWNEHALYLKMPNNSIDNYQQCVKIIFKEKEQNDGFLKCEKLIEFSTIPYRKPRNRFCQKFGSEHFLTVKFLLPPVATQMISHAQGLGVDNNFMKLLSERDSVGLYEDSRKSIDIFKNPIRIAGESFEFLCCNSTGAVTQKYLFVNSKIRKQVIDWAFQKDSDFNNKKVLKEDKPMLVPSRLSLINSLCVPTIEITESDFKEELDDGEKDLMDGCGILSNEEMLKQITEQYFENYFGKKDDTLSEDLPFELPEGYLPSVIQIRYRGFKGMLAFYPNAFSYNYGNKPIYFTKSMKKFETCSDEVMNKLQIVGMSTPFKYTILSSELIYMFMGLAKDETKLFNYLKRIVIDEREDLNGASIDSLMKDDNLKNQLLQRRGETNTNYFFGSQSFSNYLLTLNASIPKSAHTYGITDITKTLKPCEVFIQVFNKNTGKCEVIEGPVLITKTPGLYRSYIRLFQAVKKDELAHLKDVVVFSSLGPDFVPSLIAGADLDGDHFYIFWDSELVDNIQCIDEKEPSSIISYDAQVDNNSLNNKNWSHLYANVPTLSDNDMIDNSNNDNYEVAIKKSYQKLLLALDTFKYCSFSHLLELRRIFVDYFAGNWANNNDNYNIMYQIANAITCTIDAPKHGQWKEWKDFLPIISNIPKSPHYLLAGNCDISHSIYGKLFNALTDRICLSMFGCNDDRLEFSSSNVHYHSFLKALKNCQNIERKITLLERMNYSLTPNMALSIKYRFIMKIYEDKVVIIRNDKSSKYETITPEDPPKNVKIECNYDGNGGEAFYLLFENCLKKYDLETYDLIWTSPTLENPIAIDINDDIQNYRNNLISIGEYGKKEARYFRASNGEEVYPDSTFVGPMKPMEKLISIVLIQKLCRKSETAQTETQFLKYLELEWSDKQDLQFHPILESTYPVYSSHHED